MSRELRPDTFAECLEEIVILLNAGDKAFKLLLDYESGTEVQDDLTRLSEALADYPIIDAMLMDMMDGLI